MMVESFLWNISAWWLVLLHTCTVHVSLDSRKVWKHLQALYQCYAWALTWENIVFQSCPGKTIRTLIHYTVYKYETFHFGYKISKESLKRKQNRQPDPRKDPLLQTPNKDPIEFSVFVYYTVCVHSIKTNPHVRVWEIQLITLCRYLENGEDVLIVLIPTWNFCLQMTESHCGNDFH